MGLKTSDKRANSGSPAEPIHEKDMTVHWNSAYDTAALQMLGWYEKYPEPSLRLIQNCRLTRESSLLNVGAGTSTLVDELIKAGYKNIIANDISPAALDLLKERLGDKSGSIEWIVDDLTKPVKLNKLQPVDLWYDRAVLHFFTKKEDQDSYFRLLKKLVRKKGFVIIAAFNLSGAIKCSGLYVNRYDAQMLQEMLGDDFHLIKGFDHIHLMPSGETRPYVYTLFRRN